MEGEVFCWYGKRSKGKRRSESGRGKRNGGVVKRGEWEERGRGKEGRG